MSINFYIESLSLISFLLFLMINFIEIDHNSKINRIIYLLSLLFVGFTNLLYYKYSFINNVSILALITALLLVVIFFMQFLISIFSNEFIRLRLLFIPFFIILIFFRFLNTHDEESSNQLSRLFENNYLLIHIFSSLFSYSMLTISAVSSLCVFIKSKFLKKVQYNKIFSNLFPSIYESEVISIRFLYLTSFFLIVSLVSGFMYHLTIYENIDYFLDEKVILSLICLLLIIFFLFYRFLKGFSVFVTLKIILLSYLFINLAYFGIRLTT